VPRVVSRVREVRFVRPIGCRSLRFDNAVELADRSGGFADQKGGLVWGFVLIWMAVS